MHPTSPNSRGSELTSCFSVTSSWLLSDGHGPTPVLAKCFSVVINVSSSLTCVVVASLLLLIRLI